MNRKLPRYLQRIKTFYNPLDELTQDLEKSSSEEDNDSEIQQNQINEMTASKEDIESLLQRYSVKPDILNPTKFSGSYSGEDNPKEWLQRFNSYCTVNNITEDNKILIFESLLTHNAQTWFTDLGNEKKDTWVHIEENFKSAFFNSSNWINGLRLENRKLQPGESCTAYIKELTTLAQRSDVTTTELRKIILRGLPKRMMWEVVSHQPQTIQDVVQRVLLTENMFNSEQTSVCAIDDRVMNSKIDCLVNKFTASLNEIEKSFSDFKRSTEKTLQIQKCEICGRLNHTTNNCYYKNNYTTEFNRRNVHNFSS